MGECIKRVVSIGKEKTNRETQVERSSRLKANCHVRYIEHPREDWVTALRASKGKDIKLKYATGSRHHLGNPIWGVQLSLFSPWMSFRSYFYLWHFYTRE